MNEKKECKTVLLSDAPEQADKFNGAHSKLANAIFHLINTEEGGKTIGLEGNWGSGKSTVINLLDNQLSKNRDYLSVVFDAWAHQGDPLRRSFLETVSKRLIENNWVDKETWENELDIISKKKQVTTSTTSPKLTTFGIFTIIAYTILVPTGFSLLNLALQAPGYISFFGGLFTLSLFNTSAILLFSPIFLYILGIVFSLLCKISKKIPAIGNKIKCDFVFTGALIAQKFDTEVKTNTYLSPEPTSIEFEDKFSCLVNEALLKTPRKLIIILDNLDRVEPNNAISILTTLQTFLQYDTKKLPQHKGLWVVIPFDLEGLSKIWGKDEEKTNEIAKSMLNKRFQIRFFVPPLLRSDWREYTINLLKTALPDHISSEQLADLDKVYLIYSTFINSQNEIISPSPRDIKIFINQIGAIHRQWGDEFPISHIAYFVLLIQSQEDFQVKLRNKELANFEIFSQDKNILENLASMFFNVDKQLAFQFLLQNSIETAISQKDSEAIKKYERLHGKGFWATLENIKYETFSLRMLSITGSVLEESNIFNVQENDNQKYQILESLGNAIFKVSSLQELDSEITNGLISITKLTNNKNIIEKINLLISDEFNKEAKTDFSPDSISRWVDGVLEFLRNDWIKQQNIKLLDKYTIPGNIGDFINACASIGKKSNTNEYWTRYTTNHSSKEVINTFKKIISEGNLNSEYYYALPIAINILPDELWKEVAHQIYSRLNDFNNYDSRETLSLIQSLWLLLDHKYATQNQFNKLTNANGAIYHHLYNIQNTTPQETLPIAWCVYTIFISSPELKSPPGNGYAQAGHNYLINQLLQKPETDFVNNLVSISSKRGDVSFIIKLPKTANKLKEKVVEYIQDNNLLIFSAEFISNSWKSFYEFLGDKFDQFISKSNFDNKITHYLVHQEFNHLDAHLYSSLMQDELFTDNLTFIEWCKKGLNAITLETWSNELDNEGKLAELVIDIINRNKNIDLNLDVPYQDALQVHAGKTLSGQVSPSYLKDFWKELPAGLSGILRENFKMRILKTAKDAKGNIAPLFFHCYGNEISAIDLLSDKEVVLELFVPLILNKNSKGLEWIAYFLESNTDFLLNYHPRSAVEEMKKRIHNLMEEDNVTDEIKLFAQRIINSFSETKKGTSK